jgi:integrase/recombinase XerD
MIKSYVKSFEAYLQLEKGLALNSRASYKNDLKKLEEFFEIKSYDFPLEELELKHLQEYLKYLNELGLSTASQARMISTLKSFFSYLVMEKRLENSPADLLEAPKLARKLPEVLSFEELEAVFAAIDLSKAEGHRNRAMLEILYACGLRATELVELKISNLYLDIDFIKVLGKGNKERLVPIGESAQKQLGFWMKDREQMTNIHTDAEDFVFLNRRGKPLTRNMLFIIVKDAIKAANIKKNISPHSFRHSFATHLLEGGADLRIVQQLLGHESITTTEIYTHLDMQHLQETMRSFHPRGL